MNTDTPRTDGFEIVVEQESPVMGNRYRAWAEHARTLERELREMTNVASVRSDEAEGLAGRLAGAKQDTERLNWLLGRAQDHKNCDNVAYAYLSLKRGTTTDSAREAIDTAMRGVHP